MSIAPSPNVVPYADFLARRERRRRIEAELVRRDSPSVVDNPAARAAAKPIGARELACRVVGIEPSATKT